MFGKKLFFIIRYVLYLHFKCPLFWYPHPLKSHKHLPCSSIHPHLLPCPGIPLHCSIKPFQDQGPLLPLVSNKAIFCCLCIWSHVYSMCTLCLMVLFLGALGVLGGSYCSCDGSANPFRSWFLSLAPPLGTLCSVPWLAESVPLCICHALAESPR